MFSVLDTQGRIKVAPYGPGIHLADPLIPTHGGIGLTDVAQGDLYYGSAANTIARLPKSTLSGVSLLKVNNPAGITTPVWVESGQISVAGGVPQPTASDRSYWSSAPLIGTTYFDVGWSGQTAGTLSNTSDAVSPWIKHTTTAVAGGSAGWSVLDTGSIRPLWLQHEPTYIVKFRTPASLTNLRINIAFAANSTLTNGATDNVSGVQFIGLRYSTVTPDSGWVPWSAIGDNTSVTTYAAIGSVATSTVYTVQLHVRSIGGGNYVFDVNVNGTIGTGYIVPPGNLSTSMNPLTTVVTLTTVAATIETAAHYLIAQVGLP